MYSTYFSTDFYIIIGTAICLACIVSAIFIPLGNIISCRQCKQCCLRCKDRECTCNRNKTLKINYEEYMQLYGNGLLLDLDNRYSRIVSIVVIAMTFTVSMPLIYLAGFFMFFGLYIMDKYLFLRFFQNPPL